MEMSQLMAQVEAPALHSAILDGFSGPYSLGVGKAPNSTEPVLILMVPPDTVQSFPNKVTIGNDTVALIVHRDFQPPVPFGVRRGGLIPA